MIIATYVEYLATVCPALDTLACCGAQDSIRPGAAHAEVWAGLGRAWMRGKSIPRRTVGMIKNHGVLQTNLFAGLLGLGLLLSPAARSMCATSETGFSHVSGKCSCSEFGAGMKEAEAEAEAEDR